MRNISLVAALGIVLISGCKVSEVPKPESKLILPGHYSSAEADTSQSMGQTSWKGYFQDPKLKTLIENALANNQDNLMTLERIKAARSAMLQSKASLFPSIGGSAGASVTEYGEYTMDGIGNYDTNFSPNIRPDQQMPAPYTDFIIGANFEWELDVWGKLRGKRKAAVSRYLASEEMAKNVRTWLVAEVASNYYELLAIDAEVEVLSESIRLQELGLDFVTELKDGGRANQLAVDQFEALILNSKSRLQATYRLEKSIEYHLARLVGTLDIPEDRTALDSTDRQPNVLEIGLPSQLLQLRPDVREAEMTLHASKFDVAAAKAAFYPSFKLFGMAGFNAFDFSKLFLSPGSSVYQLGMGLTAPIFNRREIKTQFEIAKADQRIALLEYEKRTLNAYLEVLDLINQIDTYENQLELKEQEVAVQQRSIENSNTLFSVGYANYLEVVNAQGRALESALELADLKAARLQSHVQLYRALGGGWD
jgi:multidrug efflux system outer membrane protein